ncbi:DUF3386 family protein [Schlesneria paludicola]|uniref:DUF3386 family protein n=1 Tax=Schlesneria paludicola TaxID=360056 RepID=UPI00029A846C|nr:DUF3386 family protein [Schlesneria paludicola]
MKSIESARRFSAWRLNVMSFGFVAMAGMLTTFTQGNDSKPTEVTAVSLMKQAHDGRAEWHEFPGFRAALRVSVDGVAVEGAVSVSREGDVKVELPAGDSFAWVTSTLKSIVGHRLSSDGAIETVAFADENTVHPLGRLLKSTEASDKSLWRVQGDLLTEVHRFNDKTRFVISVVDVSRNVEGKHLPKNFSITTWDAVSGQIRSSRQVSNEWVRVGKIDLPVKLRAVICKDDGSRRVEQIELLNPELLPANASAAAAR